jgi:tetratricopeptide (TPR) repeat protein
MSIDNSLAAIAALHEAGQIASARGDYRLAAECFEQGLKLNPNWLAGWFLLAEARENFGALDDAVRTYCHASTVAPREAGIFYNLGNVYLRQGRLDDAIDAYSVAIDLKPDFAAAHSNLGLVLSRLGRPADALVCCERAVALDATNAEALTNLGNIHKEQGRLDEAIASHRQALAVNPDLASARYNLSVALHDLGDVEAAALAYADALKLLPNHAVGYSNLANVYRELGRLDEAAACYRRALEIDPDLPEGRWNQSLLRLLLGDFERGWPEYEWRFFSGQVPSREFAQPRWQGEPLTGRSILLHAEQGLGDTLQFIRFAALVKQKGGNVIVECPSGLVYLLRSCAGIDQWVPLGDELPPFNTHSPMASLPGILQTRIDSIPASVPYLFAEPALVAQWKERLSSLPGFRIAINWRGRPGRGEYRWRNIPLDHFMELGRIAGVQLISVQKGEGRAELLQHPRGATIIDFGDELDAAHGTFMDTAAVMKNVDLVITSDTAIAHLAGALGVPTWVALPFASDWRWLLDRSDSPWYPTTRLFRQKTRGDWTSLFHKIRAALRDAMARCPSRADGP